MPREGALFLARACFYPVSDLKPFFLGRWSISRRIVDRRLGLAGKMAGEGVFSPVADGLRYTETGLLHFGAYHGPVSRRYLVTFPDRATAQFGEEGGGALFRINLSAGFAAIVHQCALDSYRGRIRAIDERRWSIAWDVEGPRKHYRILSHKTRLAGP